MISMNRENHALNITNVINITLSTGIMVYGVIANSFKAEYVCYGIQTAICLTYLGIWSLALRSLFKNFKGSNRLLPKKQLFVNHAILLSIYLLASIFYNLSTLIPNWMGSTCNLNCYYNWYSIHSLAGVVKSVVETSMFVYVIYQQIPITTEQKYQTFVLKKVLLQGYATVDDIEAAVIEQHSLADQE